MRHPTTGESGVWGTKSDFIDATIAFEVEKAKAELWEKTASNTAKDARLAREEIGELKDQILKIPGLLQEEKQKSYKAGHRQGQKDTLAISGLIALLLMAI